MKSHSFWLLFPLWIFFLIAPWTPAWDLAVTHFFFQHGQFQNEGFAPFVFSYGPWPGLALGSCALCFLLLSLFKPHLRYWFRPIFFLLAVLIIFEGVVVHTLFKDHWGRPRPKQITEFGGQQAFRPYYSPNFFDQQEPSKSFPCGHCGMGFYFFALAVLGWRYRSKTVLWIGVFLGFSLGLALSWARLAQGGHFLTDVIASLLIIGYGIYFCDYLIFRCFSSYSSSSVSGSNSSSF